MTSRANDHRGSAPRLWPPALAILAGMALAYTAFIAAAGACLAESITNFGAPGCTGPVWTTIGLVTGLAAVLLGSIVLFVRVVVRVHAASVGSMRSRNGNVE